MIKRAAISIFFLVIFSCQNVERPKKPDDLIDESEMKEILYDVALVNATRDLGRDQLERAGIAPEKFIYKKYGIDSLQFAQNMAYYSVAFNKYLAIWQEVTDRLEKQSDLIDSLKRKQDSINIANRSKLNEKKDVPKDDSPDVLKRRDDLK